MVEEILAATALTRYQIVKKKHGKVPQITAGELIEAVLDNDTIPAVAAHFGVSIQTINRIFRVTFPEVRLLGKRTWRYYFLSLIDKRMCNYCRQVLDSSNFYNLNSEKSLSKLFSNCKSCDNIITSDRLTLAEGADKVKIATIYADCPKGYHVDHVMPLNRGGLHHQDNLCYLPAKLNIAKSDKLPEDVPEIMAQAIYPEFSS